MKIYISFSPRGHTLYQWTRCWSCAVLMTMVMVLSDLAAAQELKEIVPNRIQHELVMQIDVKLGPTEDMGSGADGYRINYPIIGGRFIGKGGLSGSVVPGGADMSVRRQDGVGHVEALYRLRTDDGQIIIIHNAGISRLNEVGLEKQARGEEPGSADRYRRTVPSFKTQAGPYSWLSDYIFIGTIDRLNPEGVMISIYKIDGQ